MIVIDNIIIEDDIIHSMFNCDLKKCKGACCTFPGEFGAPLLNEEISIIESLLPFLIEYLPEKAREIINKNGFYQGKENFYSTQCINNKDCVFVYYDEDVAKCTLEKAYHEKNTGWRKPLSCHLFPIRVKYHSQLLLHYEKIPECIPGIIKGYRDKIYLTDSLKEALIRAFGENWFEKVKKLTGNSI